MLTPNATIHAYTPFRKDGDLGRACNDIMEKLGPDDWALFLDHDVMVLDNSFWLLLYETVGKNPDAGAISCWTNNILNYGLTAPGCPQTNDIQEHTDFAKMMHAKYGNRVSEFGHKYHLSGFAFCISKKAWLKAGAFLHGFGNVDIAFGRQLGRVGLKLLRMDGAYLYHRRITNGFKDKVPKSDTIKPPAPCSLDAIPELMPADLPTYTGKISLVLSSLDENHEEIAATIRSFREHGVDEVILIDDNSKTPVPRSLGMDILHRNVTTAGCGVTRHIGACLATGDFLIWSDAHCRVRSGDLRTWAQTAANERHLLCAASTTYESNSLSHGARLEWRETSDEVGFKCVGITGKKGTTEPPCLLGSVYGCTKATYESMGGWVPNVGFGYNEPAFSLVARLAQVKLVCHPWFVIGHMYRTASNFRAPYGIDTVTTHANRYLTHWLLFGQEKYDEFFSKIGLPLRGPSLLKANEWIRNNPELLDIQANYAKCRRVNLEEFLDSVACPHRRPTTLAVVPISTPTKEVLEERHRKQMAFRDELMKKHADLFEAIKKSNDERAMMYFNRYIQLKTVNGPNCKCTAIWNEMTGYLTTLGITTPPQA